MAAVWSFSPWRRNTLRCKIPVMLDLSGRDLATKPRRGSEQSTERAIARLVVSPTPALPGPGVKGANPEPSLFFIPLDGYSASMCRSGGMTTETFTETCRQPLNGYTWEVTVSVTRTPLSVGHLNQEARWFQTVGSEVTKVEWVSVSRLSDLGGTPYTEAGFEVTFKCGAVGYVTAGPHEELNALVVGGKGYLHGLAVWRKHGNLVGSPVPWFQCQWGARKRLKANSAPRCCAAELYARAAGKPWGMN